MNVLGLIVEYNPFHNGHLYHLNESKKITGASHVVCVMSGNFIQRGEPAIVNKWARTRMALNSGVDLVIELPTVYSMSSAEFFAFGSIKILDSLNIIDSICFGSENGRIEELDLIADILIKEPQEYKDTLKRNLNNGLSFPKSRELSIREYLINSSCELSNLSDIISSSNNILGIEYLKALKRLNSDIKCQTIQRVDNSYNSENLTGEISSATAIRKQVEQAEWSLGWYHGDGSGDTAPLNSLQLTLPKASLDILEAEFKSGRGPIHSSSFDNMILSTLRTMPIENIKSLPYVSEGLENRIKSASRISGSINELIDNIATKRYTNTRIQRSVFSALTGLTSDEFDEFNKYGGPQYIRVLGFNNKGKELLSKINKQASLPVIIKTADFKNSCNALLKRMLEIENQATDLYVLAYKNKKFKKAGQEFTQNIVIV